MHTKKNKMSICRQMQIPMIIRRHFCHQHKIWKYMMHKWRGIRTTSNRHQLSIFSYENKTRIFWQSEPMCGSNWYEPTYQSQTYCFRYTALLSVYNAARRTRHISAVLTRPHQRVTVCLVLLLLRDTAPAYVTGTCFRDTRFARSFFSRRRWRRSFRWRCLKYEGARSEWH